MKNLKSQSSYLLPSLLAFVLATVIIYPITISGNVLAQNNQTNPSDSHSIPEWLQSIKFGKPMYVEKYLVASNGTELSSGNGTLMGINVEVIDAKTTFTDLKNNTVLIKGSATLAAKDGNSTDAAPYVFLSLGHYKNDGSFVYRGVAFFNSNATGKLSILSDVMGLYKGETKPNGDGIFIMWKLE